ncbi:hypothetical protein H6P81_010212 [Aristolochia fimbriata]|uniref:Reverse transcriptase domain-containing protein n=1 Tax=Aristolochia fimbriata TaxID=158543 RepID=A0AAV7EN47_ARIFI|nr:hypothetical protein H6P81_010212 [Aristolochia fimbriata]
MKLKLLKKKLIDWVKLKKVATATQRSLLHLQVDALDALEEGRHLTDSELTDHSRAASDLRELVARERIVWKQRARYKWLKEGDANSHFFHAVASARRRSNRVNSLIVNGELTSDREAITNALVEFYVGLYTAEPGPRHSMDGMPIASLSPDKATWLEAHFSLEEIEAAVKTFPMDKAPGPDSFNGEFFRTSWEFMKTDVIDMLNDFYHRGIVYRRLRASLISLLPKKEGVENIRDFRPISLISGPYKIVARILAGRLKTVLPDLISKEQNGFISSRQILDAAMVTHEVADRFAKAEQPRIILKLDKEKAFDMVDWDFLEAMIRHMSFGERWIGWIRSCVENASFSLLVNGGVFGRFGGSRGLWQGDPLSPLLFNIMGEGLTSLVKAALELGWLTNVLPEGLIPLSQFADDTIIFGEGSLDQVEKWKVVITLFELGSGHEVLQHFATTLGCSVGTLPSTYLGLPLFHSRISKSLWCLVIEKVQKRLSIWKGKMLSKAWRLILIRACLSGIPMHYLSFMHCPSSVVKELERLYRNFLWKGATEDFKYHLVNWRKDDGRLDSLMLSPSTDGSFTVASAYSVLLPSSDAHVSRQAWQLPAPPMVQFFIWSALHSKILTRDVLTRRGQQLNSLFCPLCDTWMETADHLLLHCEYTWKIWTWFVEQFNCSWVVPNSLASLLTASPPPHLSTMVQGKLRDSEVARPAWGVIASTRIFHPPSPPATWIPQPAGTIKVNFDGSSLGNPGPVGYGGEFQNLEGEILMSFAGPIGIEDSTSAEVHGVL